MTHTEYDDYVEKMWLHPNCDEVLYCTTALSEELGEVCGKIKKAYRDIDGRIDSDRRKAIGYEMGDVYFYLTKLAHLVGYSVADIPKLNVEKLTGRVERGTVQGEGDDR